MALNCSKNEQVVAMECAKVICGMEFKEVLNFQDIIERTEDWCCSQLGIENINQIIEGYEHVEIGEQEVIIQDSDEQEYNVPGNM